MFVIGRDAQQALVVSELRLAIGALALTIAAAVTLRIRRDAAPMVRWQRQEFPAVATGVASVAGYSVLYFPAVQLAGVASATVVAIGAAPLMTGAAHLATGRGGLSPTWLATTLIGTGRDHPRGPARRA